jgi:hypothetical protein
MLLAIVLHISGSQITLIRSAGERKTTRSSSAFYQPLAEEMPSNKTAIRQNDYLKKAYED